MKKKLAKRFRKLLPVVIDVECGGVNPDTDALLEIAAVIIGMDDQGRIFPEESLSFHVEPFEGANLDPESLAIIKMDPHNPLRYAIPEQQALFNIFNKIRQKLKIEGCQRAVLVGHNAWFDLLFIQAVVKRCKMKDNPFHSFTTFDTATLSAVAFGETVLMKAAKCAGIHFDINQAHSAVYDAKCTAELFCYIVNRPTDPKF